MNACITLIKRALHIASIQKHLPKLAPIATACADLRDDQAFEVQGHHVACPEGFCSHAWNTVERAIAQVCRGEELVGPNAFPCCADGLRPVTFHVELFEDS